MSLGDAFEQAIGLIIACHGKLIVSGLGKSGHVGRKIAATFASTGTTATFSTSPKRSTATLAWPRRATSQS